MTDKKELPQEKQIRIMEISLTLPLVAIFAVAFYLGYLKIIGVEISEWSFLSSLLLIAIGGFIVCLALNEVLQKIYGGQFKLKRLVFRWTLLTSYFSLIYGAFFCISIILPWTTTYWQFFLGTIIATGIFVILILKGRPLFNKLDKGEW
jgi:hypothetical protein